MSVIDERKVLRVTGAFRSSTDEAAYREDWLFSSRRSLSAAAAACAVLFVAFIPNDLLLTDHGVGAAVALRVVAAASLLAAAVVLRRAPGWASSPAGERFFTAVAVAVAGAFVGVVAVRPVAVTNLTVSAVLFGVAAMLFAPISMTRRAAVVAVFNMAFVVTLHMRGAVEVPVPVLGSLLAFTLGAATVFARHLDARARLAFFAVRDAAWATEQMRAALTESDRLRAELAAQLASDDLTGLASRRAFFDLAADDATAPHGAVLAIDVDHFKAVNDGHGHAAGDEVLRSVGDVIRSNIRPRDLAARIGGEEFAVWLPDADQAAAARVAERVRSAVERAVLRLHGHDIGVTVTVGTAVSSRSDSFDGLLRQADMAMYAAKNAGRNRIGCATPSCAPGGDPCGPVVECFPVSDVQVAAPTRRTARLPVSVAS